MGGDERKGGRPRRRAGARRGDTDPLPARPVDAPAGDGDGARSPAPDRAAGAPPLAVVPAPADRPDRAELWALEARLRATGAEYAADVRALTEGLGRYLRAALLDLDGEVARLRQRLERTERERDALAAQLHVSREAQRRAAAHLQRVAEALGQQVGGALPARGAAHALLGEPAQGPPGPSAG